MMTSDQAISQKAYEYWEAEGRPTGRDLEHWLKAEQTVSMAPAPKKKVRAAKAKPETAPEKKAAPAKPARAKAARRKA